jgi:hypothetical protein
MNNTKIKRSKNFVILRVLSHNIYLLNSLECKKINPRSDRIKSNIERFAKKQRILRVSFNHDNFNYVFSCNV